jgi:D-aminoacyl-tRNA deacylase
MFNFVTQPKVLKKLILFSELDIAGTNMANIFIRNFEFQEIEGKEKGKWVKNDVLLAKIKNKEILYLEKFEDFDEAFQPEICIVASRHSSQTGKPSLTAHSPGNFSIAKFGGNDKSLGIAPALYLREALIGLSKNGKNLGNYEMSLESTHHGPTQLPFPLLFLEIGSTEREWNDMKACNVVAKTIHETITKKPKQLPVAIGFGGGHYCRKFSEIIMGEEFAIGHICPKYNLSNLDDDMLKKMISQTEPKPTYALVEKKGMGTEKRRILHLLEDETELKIKFV